MHGRDSHVCRLKKALYGLKQAPRAWYSRIDSYLSIGFQKSEPDPNPYFIVVVGDSLILLLYVDDLFITGEEHLIAACMRDLPSKFEMTGLEPMHYYLGLKVWQEDGHVFLGKRKYVANVLKRFQMEGCRPMSTPMITIGRSFMLPRESWLILPYTCNSLVC